MRYYSYNDHQPDNLFAINDNVVITVSEEDIRKEYYPYWYKRLCERFGQEYVDNKYSFEDCLTDWTTIHWAWKSDENPGS